MRFIEQIVVYWLNDIHEAEGLWGFVFYENQPIEKHDVRSYNTAREAIFDLGEYLGVEISGDDIVCENKYDATWYNPLDLNRQEILDALRWVGETEVRPEKCDICEDGSVWLNLTQILPKGSVTYFE